MFFKECNTTLHCSVQAPHKSKSLPKKPCFGKNSYPCVADNDSVGLWLAPHRVSHPGSALKSTAELV